MVRELGRWKTSEQVLQVQASSFVAVIMIRLKRKKYPLFVLRSGRVEHEKILSEEWGRLDFISG